MAETQLFFETLFGRCPPAHFISLWSTPSRRSRYVPVAEPGYAAELAASLDHDGEDVYFGVCPRVVDLGPARRGGKKDIACLQAIWLDLDIGVEGHAAKNLPPTEDDALTLLDDEPTPGLIVRSGGGVHVYWLVAEPILFPPGFGIAARRSEGFVQTLQQRVIARAAARGWHVDNTANLDRVLRVPGTRNLKRARVA